MRSAPESGVRVRSIRSGESQSEVLVEQIHVCYQRMGHSIRELEKWKLKHGYCIRGISCTKKAIETASGARYGCAEHIAAAKAGIRLAKWKVFDTEYGKLRKKQVEADKEAKRIEAEREKKNEERVRRVAGVAKKRRAA